ncbi:MAG: bifunctional 5,10-methylenetetrahydrofolate dehydrogenase/5,10-methenyltetrahydrofolate cyclohydrolase [Candidatus Liptonbacteria bacterium]|nr:bifunctional 5,10-methylenetetrahydrofolate dehydrogenase/5,10-methenyltetrahydrofolate cyclohydrolase [Candidatus Liptonbacteria bacterium]
MIIDGKKISSGIIARLKSQPGFGKLIESKAKRFFAGVLVGEDPASLNFLKQKARVAEELGIEFRLYKLDAKITTDDLRHEIGRLAGPKNCGGFIVQLPLPENVNRHYALNAIPKEKDVDLLGEAALGAFYTGRHNIVPPSVGTVEEIIKISGKNLRELTVVMMGAGFLIGKPVGFWLQDKVAELTVVDRNAKYLRAKLKDADIVISGAGVPNLFSSDDLKDDALVIDFGFNPSTPSINSGQAGSGQVKNVVGDFDPESKVKGQKSKVDYTPTPGGTGPILVAKLFENFYELNRVRD